MVENVEHAVVSPFRDWLIVDEANSITRQAAGRAGYDPVHQIVRAVFGVAAWYAEGWQINAELSEGLRSPGGKPAALTPGQALDK